MSNVDIDKDEDKEKEKDAEKDTEKDAEKDTEKDVQKDAEKDEEKDAKKDTEKDAEKVTEKDAKKDTEKDTEKDTAKDTEKNIEKDAKKDTQKNDEDDSDCELGDGDKARDEEFKYREVSDVSFTGKAQRRRSTIDRNRPVRSFSKKNITPFSKPPPLTLQNTYRLTAKQPINIERIQIIMNDVIEQTMSTPENQLYTSKNASRLCMDIAAEIRNRVRSCLFDRMRIVVLVRIMEKFHSSCITSMGFLFNCYEDNWTSAEYNTNSFYLHATCYGVYFD